MLKLKWNKKRIISSAVFAALVGVCVGIVFGALPFYIHNYIDIPPAGILTVDQAGKEKFENGSEKYPFKSINRALLHAKESGKAHVVLIKGGTYREQLELSGDVTLSGIGEVEIKNDLLVRGFIVADGKTSIHNIKLMGGHNGIEVGKNAKLTLSHSEISGAKRFGILNEAQEQTNNGEDIAIFGSKISECGSQGLYLRKADIVITNSIIERNKEEGIDLHTGAVAIIRNCTITDNGEGGIETEVGENNLLIEDNLIERNRASGINLQSAVDNASIIIAGNTLKDNGAFGIRCTYHSDVTRPYFAKYVKITETNIFSGNGEREMPGTCTNKNK